MSNSGSANGKRDAVHTELVGTLHARGTPPPFLGSLDEKEDTTLVAAASAGSNQAFTILVRRHRGKILALALRFTGSREDAEDIVQQSFQKAFTHLEQFEGRSSFSTWLTRIAINEALIWRRRKRALLEVPIEKPLATKDTVLPLDFPDPSPSPEDSCLQREQERLLSAAMNELTPGMQNAIELYEFEELSARETAQALGLSVAAVKSRVFRGRRDLREVLRGYVESRWSHGSQALQANCKANGIPSHQTACDACD